MRRNFTSLQFLLALGFVLVGGVRAGATAEAGIPDSALAAELRSLAGHAGLVFVGQIVSIKPQAGAVEVTFRVEQPIAGVVGSECTMREWVGLWPSAQTRYSVGQRVLAFVYRPSPAGFNSPVHGQEGLVPVLVGGADAPELLDIRRVAASVVRAPGTALPTAAEGAIPLREALLSLRGSGFGRDAGFSRLPVPLHAHPPAAMQPRRGPEALVPGRRGGTDGSGRDFGTGRLRGHEAR